MESPARSEPFAARISAAPAPFDADAARHFDDAMGKRLAPLPEPARALAHAVAGSSPYLSRLIARDTDAFARLMTTPVEESLARIVAETDEAGNTEELRDTAVRLRRAKGEAALLCGLAEVGGVLSSLEAAAALSRFADAAVAAALRAALRALAPKGFQHADEPRCEARSGVAVLAMGKMGAQELNYSSDIDLIVIFDSAAPALGDPNAAREIAVAAARQLVKLLGEQTADGYVFRTDLRLRPDPGVSAAAVSVRAAEAYYEGHGQNWERAAFIKARACAGDLRVGEAFLKSLRPFVWRKYLDFAAIEDIHSIKRQIHAVKGGETIEFHGHNIKTGRGGIREIEFLVQTQQLILGGKDGALRARPTIDALAALCAAGQISDDARSELAENYRYLRRVEHRLQMINDEQTHKIPRDEAGAERLAIFLGEASLEAFEERLLATLRSTHRLFSELFEREERLSAAQGSLSFTGVENDKATLETIAAMGFKRPADISDTIRRWHMGSLRATRSERARELLTKLGPRLLEALAGATDPDAAFVAFDAFLRRLPGGVQVFALFANNPHVFDILIRIMTISPFLGGELSRRGHLIEAVLESGWPGPAPDPALFDDELLARLHRVDRYEGKLNEARRWGSEQNFEIAARLILDVIAPEEAARLFTATADAAIAALLPLARAETARAHGAIDGALVVLGLGRLGAGAMTARSDVDLVFIYDAPPGAHSTGDKPIDASTYHLRLVRRFLAALSAHTEEGILYEADMQLRPSGAKGPWAVSLAAFERYYEGDAWTWEEMALLKARLVAGDAGLAVRVRAAIDRIIARRRDPLSLARDIDAMRERLLAAKPPSGPFDLKHARGGFVEIDFILAFHALAAGARIGAPPPGPAAMAQFLNETGMIAAAGAATLLTASELFESVIQISRAAAGDAFAPSEAGAALAARLAAACGEASIDAAGASLVASQERVRRLYDETVISAGHGSSAAAP